MNVSPILVHWACAKIKKSHAGEDEEGLCRLIVDRLGDGGVSGSGYSYSSVAKAAYKSGKKRLATMLLDYEPQPANQVPLLLSMQEDNAALVKAIESGDTDLGKSR